MSVTAALILVSQESHTSVSHVGGKGATANNSPGLKSQDHESANSVIDKDTKGGLRESHPSCVKLQPNAAMCKVLRVRVCVCLCDLIIL